MASGRGRTTAGRVAALALLMLAGCGADEPAVVTVYGDPESTRLEVSVDTCNRNPVVTVEETSDEVHLTVAADEPSGDGVDDCMDGAVVSLDAPLGDRTVVDDSTGERVDVNPLED